MRNKVFLSYIVVGLLLCCVSAWCIWFHAYLILATCIAALFACGCAVVSWYLYQVRHIAGSIDFSSKQPHRKVSLISAQEGDLSFLSSQIDKTLNEIKIASAITADKNKRLADYLADISHQIRTPLTTMSLQLELIKNEDDLDLIKKRAEEVDSLLNRMEWLISALLKLSRLDAGVVELNKQPISLPLLVAKAFEPLALSYEHHQIEFECDIEDNIELSGDLFWTAEALTNILKNCMEHTPAGGIVALHAYQDTLATRITIQDSGPGIKKEDLPHIFERFYSNSHEVNPQGIGVGLALAQALIVAQGGAIKARNLYDTDGQVSGACFEIVFFFQTV